MRVAAAAAALAVGASGISVTTLPRPAFPPSVAGVEASAPVKLTLIASHSHAPTASDHSSAAPAGAPLQFDGVELLGAIDNFAVYGRDGLSTRLLLAFDGKGRFRYGFDFKNYVWPPRIAPGERELVYEEIVWAREVGGVLYVENAHWTYARSSYGLNGYITAIDLKTKKALWRSRALVANARTFVVWRNYLVTGYGFTAEPDYLYVLDRRTGKTVARLALPSGPERIVLRGDRVHVRTYDHDVVVELEKT